MRLKVSQLYVSPTVLCLIIFWRGVWQIIRLHVMLVSRSWICWIAKMSAHCLWHTSTVALHRYLGVASFINTIDQIYDLDKINMVRDNDFLTTQCQSQRNIWSHAHDVWNYANDVCSHQIKDQIHDEEENEWMVWKFPAAVPNFRALIIKPFWHFTDNQKHFWHFPFRFLFDFLQIYILNIVHLLASSTQ